MVKWRTAWLFAIIIFLAGCALAGHVSAGPPAEGVSWDNYIPDGVDHPAKAELTLQNGIEVLKATIPVSGTRPLLVLLVNSSDTPPLASHDAAYYDNRFFGPGPSVADYYSEVSYGSFTFTRAAVLDPGNDNAAPFWYHSTYTTAEIAGDAGKREAMIRWAIQQADADFNFAPYDTNGDGTVTNEELTIYVITSGLGGDWGGPAVWAHHWWAGSVTCDGKTIEGEYSITSEMNPIGTFSHELGHDLGLPDLYDANGGSEGIGHYGLMGSGSWCGPTHMTAWEKTQLGWLTPVVVPSNGFYDIQDSETHAEAYILRSSSHTADEYFLVENRQRGTSYDAANGPEGDLDDEGIIIYHIDEAKAAAWFSSGTNNVNNDETHKGVDVECADAPTSHTANADDLDSETNRGDANDLWDCNEYDFTDTSSPAKALWYNGGASGLSVSLFPCIGPTMRTYLAISPNLPPTADANGPYSADEGTAIVFDASGSSDPNGDALEYRWDFDGDGVWDAGWTSSATIAYTFCDEGTWTATVEARDPFGLTDQATAAVTVTNVAPVIAPIANISGVPEGTAFTVHGSFTDPGCDTWTGTVDYDDGNGPQALTLTGKTFTLSQSYCDNALYTVVVTINDDDGGSDTAVISVTVDNVPPVAHAGPDQTADEGSTVSFSGSMEDAGSCDVLTFSWDFGDASPAVIDTLTPTHAYGDNGIYTVTLTVTDDDGGVGSDTLTVTVNNVAPTVTQGAMDQPNPQFILPVVHTLTFHGTFSDPGWLDTHTASWSFGDGTTTVGMLTEENNPPDATGTVSATHAYSAPGDYTVTVTVTDDDGGATTSAAWTVHVSDVVEAKHDLAAYIQSLPSDAFKGNADQRKNALANMFDALDDMIAGEEWNGFITSLQNNIREKADGLVDGKSNDDWIIDGVAQHHICMKIDDIVAYVETFM